MTFVVELIFQASAEDRLARLKEHRDYWDDKARSGVLLGGGPWQDGSGELLLCDAPDRSALLRILRADPYVQARVVTCMKVREWDMVAGHCLPAARCGAAAPAQGGRAAASDRRRAEATDGLTAHEERIAAMMVDGMTNRRIAELLSVSTRAVELHITRIYIKLSIRSRAQLAPALNRLGGTYEKSREGYASELSVRE